MKKYQNEGGIDRLVRVILAEVLLLGGYFWLGGIWQVLAMVIGTIIFVTALTGFCSLYKLLGINTRVPQNKQLPSLVKTTFVIIFLVIAIAGSYYSNFFTKKFFLDDYNRMNNYYKQTLFYTGQSKRAEALSNYNFLVSEYATFSSKYSEYHPYALKSDAQFNNDLIKVDGIISGLKDKINTGDLKSAHLDLEAVRPVFQDILKRNGFSMLAVYLVDFHDSMEKVIAAADAKDVTGVEKAYLEASDKLKAVEEVANDVEIQAIRQELEDTLGLAKNGDVGALSAKAAELKSAFVKVYLKRG